MEATRPSLRAPSKLGQPLSWCVSRKHEVHRPPFLPGGIPFGFARDDRTIVRGGCDPIRPGRRTAEGGCPHMSFAGYTGFPTESTSYAQDHFDIIRFPSLALGLGLAAGY